MIAAPPQKTPIFQLAALFFWRAWLRISRQLSQGTEFARQWHFKLKRFARHGMREGHTPGVQRLPGQRLVRLTVHAENASPSAGRWGRWSPHLVCIYRWCWTCRPAPRSCAPSAWCSSSWLRCVRWSSVSLRRFSKRHSADLWGEPFAGVPAAHACAVGWRLASRTRRVRATRK